jgi:transcriptional regulator of nitric oxide reductase
VTEGVAVSQFQKVAAIALSLCGVAMLAAGADRIFTAPNPAAELKRLFPGAAVFSALTGEPLHFTAYGADPKANPSAPIHILVGMDMSGVLTGVVVTYNSEPYGYFSVEPPKFAIQFKGKKISDPFRVGGDVDAVSRASISIASATRAIRDSARMVAKQLLPEAGK